MFKQILPALRFKSAAGRALGCVLLFAGCCARAGQTNSAGQWIVVTPPTFRPTLEPLIQHRKEEGFAVVVVDTMPTGIHEQLMQADGKPLKARLEQLIRNYPGRSFVLLAGAHNVAGSTNVDHCVPSLHGAFERMKNQPSDAGYGLPDSEGAPTVPVGRFPARNSEELSAMVQKTLKFETDLTPAPWRNRLLLLLGNPGGGSMAENYVQDTLDADLAALDPSWEVRTMFNAASSRFYLPRPVDRDTALQSLAGGVFFSVYLGHSGADGLGLDMRFIQKDSWTKLNIAQGAGPFFTCGCFACQPDEKGEGYGLAAMRNGSGPVAVIGATGESYSAPGQLAAEGLMTCLSGHPFPERLGDYWLAAANGLARGKMGAMVFALMDMTDGSGGKIPLATQRREHLEMWMLFGDPALRMPAVSMDVLLKAGSPIAGKALVVSGVLPKRFVGAKVRVTLERPINSKPAGLETVPSDTPENRDARKRVINANFERANTFVLDTADAEVSGNQISASLKVPANLPWTNLVLRAFAVTAGDAGLGILTLPVAQRSSGAQ